MLLSRHALMVERMLPIYEEARAAQAMDLSGLEAAEKGRRAAAKLAAADVIASLGPVLFPEGADG